MGKEQETTALLFNHLQVEITSATAEETVVDHTLGTILTIKLVAVEQEDTPETVVTVSIKTVLHLGLQVLVAVEQVALKEVGLIIQVVEAVASVSMEKVLQVLQLVLEVLEVQTVDLVMAAEEAAVETDRVSVVSMEEDPDI